MEMNKSGRTNKNISMVSFLSYFSTLFGHCSLSEKTWLEKKVLFRNFFSKDDML